MPSINKKNTRDLAHYAARTITNIQVITNDQEQEVPVVAFIGGKGGGAVETVLPMTPEAWARAAMGTGTSVEALRDGLNMASRYRFQVLTDKIKNESGKEEETVVGIHCIPDDNYIQCNFGLTLNRPNITEDMAVVQIHDNTGEMDIVAFPGALRRSVNAFLKELEGITEFDNSTTFVAEGVSYTIMNAFGSEISFRCTKRR